MLKIDKSNILNMKNDLNEIVIDKNVSVLYDGSENLVKERESLLKEKERLIASIERREKLLSNKNYTSKAPENIVKQEMKNLSLEKENLEAILMKLK